LREKECDIQSMALLCPAHTHTSPKTTLCSSSVALLRQPVHAAEMETLVPAAAGRSSAFQVGSGASKGVKVAMS
jgi:hypothetical protein